MLTTVTNSRTREIPSPQALLRMIFHMVIFVTCVAFLRLVHTSQHKLDSIDPNWPEQVDPVTRHAHRWRASPLYFVLIGCSEIKKVEVAHTRLQSVRFQSWSRFLAASLQVTWVINPAVGCHYFSPGLQLPSQPLRGLLPISLLGEQSHDVCEQFA